MSDVLVCVSLLKSFTPEYPDFNMQTSLSRFIVYCDQNCFYWLLAEAILILYKEQNVKSGIIYNSSLINIKLRERYGKYTHETSNGQHIQISTCLIKPICSFV